MAGKRQQEVVETWEAQAGHKEKNTHNEDYAAQKD